MSKNIEIKARYPDLQKAEQLAQQLGAAFLGTDRQVDTFFHVPKGRLKLRESSLNGTMLIPYLRPDRAQAKDSRYVLLPVQDASATKALLDEMFGRWLVVEKTRRIYLYRNVRIHLDQVKGLGNFMEFEAVVDEANDDAVSRQRLEMLKIHFGLRAQDLVPNAYADLLTKE
ncbi:adenylate cyclase [candidate division KSB1 bacterium]|nr:MAG: adenylate cyclase [candidate division KSB1 bacterium]